MDIATIGSLIGSLGFPIVCCGALFWYINNQGKQHREEMEKITTALNNNTIALNELIVKLEKGD